MNWTHRAAKWVAVILDENRMENLTHPLPGFRNDAIYLVLGEVAYEQDTSSAASAVVQGIRHYVLLDLSSGNIMPGMYHAERFRGATEDEL